MPSNLNAIKFKCHQNLNAIKIVPSAKIFKISKTTLNTTSKAKAMGKATAMNLHHLKTLMTHDSVASGHLIPNFVYLTKTTLS